MTSPPPTITPDTGRFDALARAVGAGVVCGFLAVIQSAGFGLFVLGGSAHALAPVAVGIAIFATAAATLVAVFTSSVPGTVSIAQTVPIAALTTGVAHILAATGGDSGSAAAAATMVAFVALGSLAFGLAALGLGAFRWGRFIRFVPYPVIAGFFAGCGWLIMLGGIGVAAGHRIGTGNIGLLADSSVQLRLLATLLIVGAIAILVRRFPLSTVLPGVAAVALAAYTIVAAVIGFEPAAAIKEGWLVNLSGEGALWPPVALADLALIDLGALSGAFIALPVLVILSVMTLLMNASAIELATRRDIDLDHELRSVGVQNLVSGAGGGLPAFHSVPLTLLAARLKATGPLVGLITAGICGAILVFGDVFLSHVPTPLLGGLVVWVGLSLVIDWLVRAFPRLPREEYLVVVLIFLAIVFAGLAYGLLVGLIAAAVLFVVEYGRVEIVRHVLTGRDYQSGADGSEGRHRALQSAGDAILIVRLQGFLFFGTADRMRRRIQRLIEQDGRTPVRYLLVDFRRVSGLDSSTVISLTRLAQMTGSERFTLVLCGMSEAVRRSVAKGGLTGGPESQVRFVGDLDEGLAACEDELLAGIAPDLAARRPVPVADTLAVIIGDRALAEALATYLDRVEVGTGGTLIEQGAPSDDVFFIEEGHAAVILDAGKERVRLATVGPGAIAGEMAFYLRNPRSASVIAEAPLIAWRLSAASLRRLEIDSPETLVRFHRGMAAILADRLTGANRLVRLLAD